MTNIEQKQTNIDVNSQTPNSSQAVSSDGVQAAVKSLGVACLQLLSVIGRSVVKGTSTIASKTSSSLGKVFKSKPIDMKRCGKGHYFDPQKSLECPLCSGERISQIFPVSTKPREFPGSHQTVGFMVREQGIDPTVGWLVCTKGPVRGRDFRILSERNAIGRSDAMPISINDESISRENHAAIIFNPLDSTFKLQPGDGRGLVYVNRQEALQTVELKSGDTISIGASELIFIPFAGVFFDWKAS